MGLENRAGSRYVGLNAPKISTDQINQFLAAHPITAEDPLVHAGTVTGELQTVNPNAELDRIGLVVIGRDLNTVIAADAPFQLKREVCMAKIDTIVRMQNPELATEECVVYKKAEEIEEEFHIHQALLHRNEGVTLDELSAMENPAELLIHDFHEHLGHMYDMRQLQAKAGTLLEQFIEAKHIRDFETLVALERADDPSRVAAFGSSVTSRIVSIAA